MKLDGYTLDDNQQQPQKLDELVKHDLWRCLLIYFTDGYGEDEIPKPKTYCNLWVIIGGAQQLSVKEPYGVVLSL